MNRLFPTHLIRPVHDAAPLWTLSTIDEGGLSTPIQALVPSVWEMIPALHHYRGRAVYKQQLECGGNIRFHFGGVSFRARVLLDELELATHYGAYTAFDAVAHGVPYGLHTLRVEVDNRFGPDSTLHFSNDYYSYGGITRPVSIEQLSEAYLTKLHMTPICTGGEWKIQAEVEVRNLSDMAIDGIVQIHVGNQHEASTSLLIPAHGSICASMTMACPGVQSWSPASPKLYSVSAQLIVNGQPIDDLIDRIGFRTIEIHGRDILLNGKKLIIKGFNRHEAYGSFGCTVPVEAMMHDILLMKDMGANAVRTSHYPNDPRFLDLCDEVGMLVWEESHARGITDESMRNPLFMEQHLLCTAEMVSQHDNHPCIFIWGCLNECADDTDHGASCYRATFRLLNQLDASRPMTAALLGRPGSKVFGDSDVVSVNLYPQWYFNMPVADCLREKMEEINQNGGSNKPVIISEIGAGAIYGYHDPIGEAKWSEERQCTILREQIQAVLCNTDLSGLFIWQFADIRVDENWAMSRPRTHNNKGILNEYRQPKMAYTMVKELFHRL